MDEENPFSHDDEWIQCQLAGTARHILPFDIDIWHSLNLTLPSFFSLSHCLGTDKESGKLFIRYEVLMWPSWRRVKIPWE